MDQAISLNTRYDNTKYPDNKVPATVILNDMTLIYKLGLKTGYYHNNRKVITVENNEPAVVEQELDDEASCASCVI
ncbi:Ribonucleoside-diphosphate reductase 1 subunit alpha [compost metagenome]